MKTVELDLEKIKKAEETLKDGGSLRKATQLLEDAGLVNIAMHFKEAETYFEHISNLIDDWKRFANS